MPPGRAYDALAVLCTAVDVLRRAALINVERSLPFAVYETRLKKQATRPTAIEKSGTGSVTLTGSLAKAADFTVLPNTWSYARPLDDSPTRDAHSGSTTNTPSSPPINASSVPPRDTSSIPSTLPTNQDSLNIETRPIQNVKSSPPETENTPLPPETSVPLDDFDYTEDAEVSLTYTYPCITQIDTEVKQSVVKLTPSRVPSSRLGRLFHYGSTYILKR